jgi:sporulation protein YlmC with PRC-barrel domain
MKMTSKKIAPSMMAALCLGLALIYQGRGGEQILPQQTPGYPAYREKATEPNLAITTPARYHKASGIIGMEVRNRGDEHLGNIKDVVFDLQNERVAYLVMTAAPKSLLSLKEKLLAVPLNAFTASSDEKHLILNADKSKVEAAIGIDRNNWPSPSYPSFGAEPFWRKDVDQLDESDDFDETPLLTTPDPS